MKPTVMSFALEVPKFGGPLTAPEISHWLWRCNQAFKKWEKFYNREMDDETKVEETGNAILNEGVTKGLYEWWVANARHLVEKDWNTFQGLFRDEALGKEWKFKALREYYTATQGNMSARDFHNKLQTLSAVISQIGGDSMAIDPFAEKCHLLFRARPSVLDAVLENQLDQLSILQEEPEAILQRLEKYTDIPTRFNVKTETEKTATTPKPTAKALKAAKPQPKPIDLPGIIYLIGDGSEFLDNKTHFSDLEYLPGHSSPKIRSIKLYCRSVEAGTLLSYEIEHTEGSFAHAKLSSGGNEGYPATILYLDGDEHIVSCRYTSHKDHSAEKINYVVRDLMLETSKGKTLSIGMLAADWDETIVAPTGWAIVGFHGYTTQGLSVNAIKSLGCIFGRRWER